MVVYYRERGWEILVGVAIFFRWNRGGCIFWGYSGDDSTQKFPKFSLEETLHYYLYVILVSSTTFEKMGRQLPQYLQAGWRGVRFFGITKGRAIFFCGKLGPKIPNPTLLVINERSLTKKNARLSTSFQNGCLQNRFMVVIQKVVAPRVVEKGTATVTTLTTLTTLTTQKWSIMTRWQPFVLCDRDCSLIIIRGGVVDHTSFYAKMGVAKFGV